MPLGGTILNRALNQGSFKRDLYIVPVSRKKNQKNFGHSKNNFPITDICNFLNEKLPYSINCITI